MTRDNSGARTLFADCRAAIGYARAEGFPAAGRVLTTSPALALAGEAEAVDAHLDGACIHGFLEACSDFADHLHGRLSGDAAWRDEALCVVRGDARAAPSPWRTNTRPSSPSASYAGSRGW